MKKSILFLSFLIINSFLFAQTAIGDVEIYMDNKIDNMPGNTGNDYTVPNASELGIWKTTIDFLLADRISEARSSASEINYQITEFTDTSIIPNQIFYILEEKSSQLHYWGIYIFSKTPTRNNLILQAPHCKYDTNTGKQAIYCFKNIVAKAVFINGTHRCNSDSYSSCSGTTGVCGKKNESYKISDLAHTTISMFQKTTEFLFNKIQNSVFIQLHGFTKKSTDPYVIMSNGTRVTPDIDYAEKIKDALLSEDNSLNFKIAHIDLSWTRLIAFTNTQGRMINNSSDFCNNSATNTSGRFIHIEQEKYKLRNNEVGWAKMSNALSDVFSSTLGVSKFEIDNPIVIFPNPSSGIIKIKSANIKSIEIFNTLGQKLNVVNNKNDGQTVIIDLHQSDRGIYLLKIFLRNNHFFTSRIMRK